MTFDYAASAELFMPKRKRGARQPLSYRRFATAADVPADVLDKVFDRFQSHTVGSRHRGVGLGLSLVKSLVESHGGQVLIDPATLVLRKRK